MRRIAVFCGWLILWPLAAVAQTTGGTLAGRVADESNTPLRGVTVTATHVATGVTRVARTAADGRYRFYSLATGTYEISTELAGHIAVSARKAEVALGTKTRVDFVLKGSDEDEQMTVTAQARFLESTPSIYAIVPRDIVTAVPLRDRDASELASVAPFSQISPVHEVLINGATAAVDLPVDAIEQINITSRQPSVEYGRASGGVLRFASKAGEYEYEGDAFTLFRNHGEGLQWGVAGGGPIVKERSHFFAAFDGGSEIRERLFAAVDGDVSARHFVHAGVRAAHGGSRAHSVMGRDLWQVRENLWSDLRVQSATGTREIRETIAGTRMVGATRHDWTAGAVAAKDSQDGVFFQDEIVARKFAITAGVRYDDEFSPRLGVVYDVNGSGRNLVRASYGKFDGRTDTALGYSWQVNPWVALNADALHTRPSFRSPLAGLRSPARSTVFRRGATGDQRPATEDAVAIGGRVQFSSTLSVVGSYTFTNVRADETTPRHFFRAAGILHLPGGFWLSGTGGHRSATSDRHRETEIDLRVAKTFEWGKGYTLDVMLDGFDVFRRGAPDKEPAEQVGLRVNF